MQSSCNLEYFLNNKESLKGVSRSQFEIVITRFDEDLEWTKGIEHLCTVYNKGKPFTSGATVIDVPNHGVGSETMLRHIVERYYTLADATFFCQGNVCDRVDQPLYPLTQYAKCSIEGLVCVKGDLYEMPDSRFRWRVSSPECNSIEDRTFSEWRKYIGIRFRGVYESWVKGDWIAVGCGKITARPKKFYADLYDICKFDRGILVEECWFLERTFHTLFDSRKKT